jgi:hypothetical protein
MVVWERLPRGVSPLTAGFGVWYALAEARTPEAAYSPKRIPTEAFLGAPLPSAATLPTGLPLDRLSSPREPKIAPANAEAQLTYTREPVPTPHGQSWCFGFPELGSRRHPFSSYGVSLPSSFSTILPYACASVSYTHLTLPTKP